MTSDNGHCVDAVESLSITVSGNTYGFPSPPSVAVPSRPPGQAELPPGPGPARETLQQAGHSAGPVQGPRAETGQGTQVPTCTTLHASCLDPRGTYDLPWSAGEPLLAGFPRGPDPTRRPPLPPGPCAARTALCGGAQARVGRGVQVVGWAYLRPSFARWTLGTRHLARLPLGRLGSFLEARCEGGLGAHRQLVAGLPLHRVGIAGHHHPLQVDRLRLLALNLFADENLPIEVDPGDRKWENARG